MTFNPHSSAFIVKCLTYIDNSISIRVLLELPTHWQMLNCYNERANIDPRLRKIFARPPGKGSTLQPYIYIWVYTGDCVNCKESTFLPHSRELSLENRNTNSEQNDLINVFIFYVFK